MPYVLKFPFSGFFAPRHIYGSYWKKWCSPSQSELPRPFRWVFSHGRTYLTGPPPWRFLQEAPCLSSALQRRCLTEVYIIFGSLCKYFDCLYFTPISVILHGICVH